MIEQLRHDLIATAEELAPSITMYGLSDPSVVPVDPDAYARGLEMRIQVEQALATQKRQEHSELASWSYADGLYYKYGDDIDERISKLRHPLFPEEIAIAHGIDAALEKDNSQPVVALDFGGGMGLSWMRLAAQPRYREAIEESKLAMVVTNLGSKPDTTADASGYTGIPRSMKYINRDFPEYTREDLHWAQENQAYVQYIDANALELPTAHVQTLDGTPVPLMGSVAVVHEHLSLAHTHAPDIALAVFGRLLAAGGVLRSDVATHYHLMHPELFLEITLENGRTVQVNSEYSQQRRLGLIVGSMLLRQTDFAYELDDDADRGIFTRTNAEA